jgi:hypothetical protein
MVLKPGFFRMCQSSADSQSQTSVTVAVTTTGWVVVTATDFCLLQGCL